MSGLNERNGDHDKSDKIKNHAGKQENGKEVVRKRRLNYLKRMSGLGIYISRIGKHLSGSTSSL